MPRSFAPRADWTWSGPPGLRKELRDLVDEGRIRLVVDLSGTEFIDSSGLSALISGLKAARQSALTDRSGAALFQALLSRTRVQWLVLPVR